MCLLNLNVSFILKHCQQMLTICANYPLLTWIPRNGGGSVYESWSSSTLVIELRLFRSKSLVLHIRVYDKIFFRKPMILEYDCTHVSPAVCHVYFCHDLIACCLCFFNPAEHLWVTNFIYFPVPENKHISSSLKLMNTNSKVNLFTGLFARLMLGTVVYPAQQEIVFCALKVPMKSTQK